MDYSDFERTLVLEKLAQLGQVDAFLEAVDSDDFQKAASLMRKAGVDPETIAIVLRRMSDPDGPKPIFRGIFPPFAIKLPHDVPQTRRA
jgi:hypothetical protein